MLDIKIKPNHHKSNAMQLPKSNNKEIIPAMFSPVNNYKEGTTIPATSQDGKLSTTKLSNHLFKSIDFHSNNESDVKQNAKSYQKARISHGEGMIPRPFKNDIAKTTTKH
jgi:hypothetical protein